jgi:anti-sigma factor RsiW
MNRRHENQPRPSDAELQLEETEALIWDLLDERLDDAGFARLSQSLEANATVRSRYMECVQLHVDLHEHFGRQALDAKQQASGTAVLPNLLTDASGLPGFPTVIQ